MMSGIQLMKTLFATATDLNRDQAVIQACPYGVIETRHGQLAAISFRPWPKWVTVAESTWSAPFRRSQLTRDRCKLYFNQPRFHPDYLALKFIESSLGTSLATLYQSVRVLDEVARIKRSQAILAHVTNPRISDRLLKRLGWQRHLLHKRGRHFIKRFPVDRSAAFKSRLLAEMRSRQLGGTASGR